MRLIDADTLMKAIYHRAFETDGDTMWQSGCWVRYRAIEQVVKEQPTVDAEPVRHGHWIHWAMSDECSECGYDTGKYGEGTKFCPNCGVRMQEGEEA